VSTGTDTKANALAAGALEVDNLRLLEDGSERGGALVSDRVVSETAREGLGVRMVREYRRVNGH
jgi:hypothetical protein